MNEVVNPYVRAAYLVVAICCSIFIAWAGVGNPIPRWVFIMICSILGLETLAGFIAAQRYAHHVKHHHTKVMHIDRSGLN